MRWLGTLLCLIGIFLTSVNIYPANLYFGFIGSFIWACVGLQIKDYALWLVEAVAVIMYLGGIVKHFT
jgi:hypothetical protein